MNKITKSIVVAALAALATPAVSFAAVPDSATQNVPGLINYQGVLRNPATGAAYADGIYTLDLRIWNNASSTASSGCLWGGQYSVYVKDGYFNVMLGDTAGKDLTVAPTGTYKNNALWKAMWGASDTATTYYLGVTPYQDYRCSAIANPTEILPRQQLLSSPFAFRAQHAYYADASKATTFTAENGLTVNGATTLKGAVTFNGNITANGTGSQKFGPISTSSTQVSLTGKTALPTASTYASTPSVYDVGQYLYFYSYYAMTFQSANGDMSFTVPSTKTVSVAGGAFKSTATDNTIGSSSGSTVISGSGNSYINLDGTGYMQLKTTNRFNIESHGANSNYVDADDDLLVRSVKKNLYLKAATNVTAQADNGSVYVLGNPTTSGTGVCGRGNLLWYKYGQSSGGMIPPFKWVSVTLTVSSGSGTNLSLSTTNVANFDQYDWTITNAYSGNGNFGGVYLSGTPSATSNTLYGSFTTSSSSSRTIHVILLGIHKSFTSGVTYLKN